MSQRMTTWHRPLPVADPHPWDAKPTTDAQRELGDYLWTRLQHRYGLGWCERLAGEILRGVHTKPLGETK